MTRTAHLPALLALALAAPLSPAFADAAAHSTVRLIAGDPEGGAWPVGVEITLAKGWKTYWRMPGESGIPPEFDWSGSRNVARAEVHFPAPGRFEDAGGETIGYKRRVVFPVDVTAGDAAEPVDLKLTLHYAVCKDICVPARAEVVRTLTHVSAPAKDAESLARFAGEVPKETADGLAVEGVRLAGEAGRPELLVELSGAHAGEARDIFVEGFDRAYFRAPRRLADGDRRLYALPIDGLKDPGALKGKTLTLTVVSDAARLVREARVE